MSDGRVNNGGARAGAGRPPKIRGLITDVLEWERKDAAAYAFNLIVTVMHDDAMEADVRISCAKEVLDRVCGKPVQSLRVGGDSEAIPVQWTVDYRKGMTDASDNAATDAATRPT
jgi:hypothetical protein